MLFVSLLALLCHVFFLASTSAYTSRESVISKAAQSSLNSLFLNAYHRIIAMTDFSGTVSNTPIATPYFHSYANLTGDSQEAVFGITRT